LIQPEKQENCPLCNVATSNILADRLRRGNGKVYYCSPCDHGFLVPEKKIDAKAYYSEDYRKEYSHKATGEETNARELFETYKKFQKDRLSLIAPYLSTSKTLLEVGASAGQFLVNIVNQVKLINAIELDKACCKFVQNELKIDADYEFLSESKFNKEKYDVVCSFQVMEHVDSPAAFLGDLKSSMKKDGMAFIEVPNLRDPLLSVWNVKSYQTFYYHSAHLHYFTESSLRKVAGDAGFTPDQISFRFLQDYNLLNHLNWITNDSPQATCDVGLSDINLHGPNKEISGWLTEQIKILNSTYVNKLIETKNTSNIMMILKNS
jgi:2-polyprenyl-3-methyl-5-hydroxy-6-metoxy-1,4-benzoquinol methylase